MKITSLGQFSSLTASGSVASRSPGMKPLANDQAQLTNLSAYLASAQSNSPARLERLTHLSAAVSNGQYHVDAGVVSNRIIEDSFSARAA
jgi:anti-sigma28 factor (negative regulator of flagellin synthesis)